MLFCDSIADFLREYYKEALKKAGFEIISLEHKTIEMPFSGVKNFYKDISVTDYIAPLLTPAEREELIMGLIMDKIDLAREKGRDHFEGEWLYVIARNLNGIDESTLFAKSKIFSPEPLFLKQTFDKAILQAA